MISHELLLNRIMQPVPAHSFVVPVSLPVTSFGDPNTARVATISINPSVNEFCSPGATHPVLAAGKKRFVDRETLGLADDATPTREQAEQVLQSNHDYFKNNPYWWFNALENWILNPIGASYFDGTATHLDLVQWATDPVWTGIKSKTTREALVAKDREFLDRLIKDSGFDLLLINSDTVFRTLSTHTHMQIHQTETWKRSGADTTTMWSGTLAGKPFIAWSKFLQRYVSNAQRQEIRDWVVDHARSA